jgi:glycosyltransferase involved in cell wall biosynthesis
MKPKVLAILPVLIPSTLINVATPIVDLHTAGKITARVALEPYVKERDLKWCDLAILCRNTDPQTGRWFLKLLQDHKPYIYDIDDNFFELPPDTVTGKYHTAPERIAMLEEYIRRADLVRVYSDLMFAKLKTMNSEVIKVNGTVDWRLLRPPRRPAVKDVVRIVYATSRVKDTLAELFKPALERVLKKYQSQIEVYFLGYNPPEFKTYPNVFYKPLTLNYEQYMRYFSAAGFDIGLAPLLNDVFHRSKTNLKVREYGACRIAGIYSDVDVYSTTVIQGETGILVKNDVEAWYTAISQLIENKDLRTHIQEKAFHFAQENFSQTAFTQIWFHHIYNVIKQPKKKNDDYRMTIQLLLSESPVNASLRDGSSKRDPERLKTVLSTLPLLQRATGFYRLARSKLPGLISGLRSEGMEYLIRTTRFYIETYWVLLKIRLELFLSSTKSSSSR